MTFYSWKYKAFVYILFFKYSSSESVLWSPLERRKLMVTITVRSPSKERTLRSNPGPHSLTVRIPDVLWATHGSQQQHPSLPALPN